MPDWHELLDNIKEASAVHDQIRKKFLKKLYSITKRNIIAYYSGWLQKPNISNFVDFGISDADKNGFMAAIHGMDRSKGLDIILHTPGGDMAATESIINYLRAMFNEDIRAFIPQIAMSGGSMIACACKEIVMGAQSNIGPFDPQIGPTPCQAILGDLKRARDEMTQDRNKALVWQPILQKYNLGFFVHCQNAIDMADDVVRESLKSCMFKDSIDAEEKVDNIISKLGSNAETKMHARHIHKKEAKNIGLKIVDLEDDQKLQDAVLSLHHAYILTFEQTPAIKIVENQNGKAHISTFTT